VTDEIQPCGAPPHHWHSTTQFASFVGIAPQSLRKRYSQTGSYFGVRPVKLPNGKLRWPEDALTKMICPPLN